MTPLVQTETVDIPHDPNRRQLAWFDQEYRDYLEGDYERHRNENGQWKEHEKEIDAQVAEGIDRICEKAGKDLGEVNILVIGPGLKPAGRELQANALQRMRKVKRVIIGDVSEEVAQRAADNLVKEGGIPAKNILRAQVDVGAGRSIIYGEHIANALEHVDNLDALSTALTRLTSKPIAELVTTENLRLPYEQRDGAFRSGHNVFTKDGTLIPIDGVFYQMVLAGIGAAAESKAWALLYRFIEESVGKGTKADQKAFAKKAKFVREQIHQLIAAFHTFSAIGTYRDTIRGAMASGMRPPIQISVNDIATTLVDSDADKNSPLSGGATLPRIHSDQVLAGVVAQTRDHNPVTVEMEDLGIWYDEAIDTSRPPHIPGHGHPKRVTRVIPE